MGRLTPSGDLMKNAPSCPIFRYTEQERTRSQEMPHDPPPARETDRPEASAEPKRAWSKPRIKRMTYVNIVASGPHAIDNESGVKYRPPS